MKRQNRSSWSGLLEKMSHESLDQFERELEVKIPLPADLLPPANSPSSRLARQSLIEALVFPNPSHPEAEELEVVYQSLSEPQKGALVLRMHINAIRAALLNRGASSALYQALVLLGNLDLETLKFGAKHRRSQAKKATDRREKGAACTEVLKGAFIEIRAALTPRKQSDRNVCKELELKLARDDSLRAAVLGSREKADSKQVTAEKIRRMLRRDKFLPFKSGDTPS